jgi:hypothetical protein
MSPQTLSGNFIGKYKRMHMRSVYLFIASIITIFLSIRSVISKCGEECTITTLLDGDNPLSSDTLPIIAIAVIAVLVFLLTGFRAFLSRRGTIEVFSDGLKYYRGFTRIDSYPWEMIINYLYSIKVTREQVERSVDYVHKAYQLMVQTSDGKQFTIDDEYTNVEKFLGHFLGLSLPALLQRTLNALGQGQQVAFGQIYATQDGLQNKKRGNEVIPWQNLVGAILESDKVFVRARAQDGRHYVVAQFPVKEVPNVMALDGLIKHFTGR